MALEQGPSGHAGFRGCKFHARGMQNLKQGAF